MKEPKISEEKKEANFAEYLYELILREDSDVSEEDKKLLSDFIITNTSSFIEQAMIGFRLTTKEELDKQKAKIEDKVLEKKLM